MDVGAQKKIQERNCLLDLKVKEQNQKIQE
jgi:hypothetical protein